MFVTNILINNVIIHNVITLSTLLMNISLGKYLNIKGCIKYMPKLY